jgi:hypothetical protein
MRLFAASGKILKTAEYNFLPKYQDEIERLKLAKESFQHQIDQLERDYADYSLKMIDFRIKQREWELELLEAIFKADLVDLYTKTTMKKIRDWVKQENRREDDPGEFDTFFYGSPAKLNDRTRFDSEMGEQRPGPCRHRDGTS